LLVRVQPRELDYIRVIGGVGILLTRGFMCPPAAIEHPIIVGSGRFGDDAANL
jgi:hypothetical protein